MKIKDIVQSRFDKYQKTQNSIRGVLGNLATGVVEVTGKTSTVYVTLMTGQVLDNVVNTRIPNSFGRSVKIGYDSNDKPGVLQILGYGGTNSMGLDDSSIGAGAHHTQHQWPGSDTVFVWGEQFMPSLFVPVAGTLTVSIYPGIYPITGGFKKYDAATAVPLDSYVATIILDEAKLVAIVVDDAGDFQVRDGTPVAAQADPPISAYSMLTDTDIPSLTTGDVGICAVRLYYGQLELLCNGQRNDFIDMRFARSGGGGGSSPGGGHTIQDEGVDKTQRTNLNFTGVGVTVTDDPGDDATVVTIPDYTVPVKASGAEVDTGTNDTKFATPKAITDSDLVMGPDAVVSGNVAVWDGVDGKLLADGGAYFYSLHIDQYGGTGDSFGVLVKNSSTSFTVSQGIYLTGTLSVYRNGQLLTQGSAEDWHEHDPATGVFHTQNAVLAADQITVIYATLDSPGILGTVEEAPDNDTGYVRKNEGWVPEGYNYMDQTGGTGDTCGVIAGAMNSVNTDFEVAQHAYISGSLQVYLNGILQLQGTAEDWVELIPASGTFRMNVAPASTDEITVSYLYSGVITVVGDKHVIQEEGGNLTARTKLNFIGPNVTAEDNAGDDSTDITVKTLVQHGQIIWTIESAYLAVANQGLKPLKLRLPYVGVGATIEEVYAQVNTCPTVANLRIDIHKNGSSIFTATQYVEIVTTQYQVSKTTDFAGGGAIAKDDYFQMELVQGDATAADLVLHMRYKWILTDV